MSWVILGKKKVIEGDSGTTAMVFEVAWTGEKPFFPNTKLDHVNVKLHYGDTDLFDVGQPTEVVIKPGGGNYYGTFTVHIIGDEKDEEDETFEVEITSAVWRSPDGTLQMQNNIKEKQKVTIKDDDDPVKKAADAIPDGDAGIGGPSGTGEGEGGTPESGDGSGGDGSGGGESDGDGSGAGGSGEGAEPDKGGSGDGTKDSEGDAEKPAGTGGDSEPDTSGSGDGSGGTGGDDDPPGAQDPVKGADKDASGAGSWVVLGKEKVVEGDSGIAKMVFEIAWTGEQPAFPNSTLNHVNVRLNHGSTDGADVSLSNTQIDLKPGGGMYYGTFEVFIHGDEDDELDETFEVEIESAIWIGPGGKTLVQDDIGETQKVTIKDDDDPVKKDVDVIRDGDTGIGSSGGTGAGEDAPGTEDPGDATKPDTGDAGDGSNGTKEDGVQEHVDPDKDSKPDNGDADDSEDGAEEDGGTTASEGPGDASEQDASGNDPASGGKAELDVDLVAPEEWKPGGTTVRDELGFDPVELFNDHLKAVGLFPTETARSQPADDTILANASQIRDAPMIADGDLEDAPLDVTDVFVFVPVISGSTAALAFDPNSLAVTGGLWEPAPHRAEDVMLRDTLQDEAMALMPIESFDFFG